MTQADFQRYVRTALQWLASWLVARGVLVADATWIEPAIGVVIAASSLAWTWWDTRPAQKITDTAKLDEVAKITVTTKAMADASPENVVKGRDH